MKSVTTYIHFSGNCRQAMSFYHTCLGGDLQLVPQPDASGKPSTEPNAKLMHSQISLGGTPILMGTDEQHGASVQPWTNFSVSVDCESLDEIERLFGAISDKGQVRLPLGTMPWGARFGMLTDQFGVQWILNCALHQ